MVGWMDREALKRRYTRVRSSTIHARVGSCGARAIFWSNTTIVDIRIDCDKDTVLLGVLQTGVARHTGRRSLPRVTESNGEWEAAEPVEVDPKTLYGGDT